jgi:DnaJ homolog subfamily A member 5
MKECFYSILGVEKKAADDVIKKAYRQLALKHHPDKHTEENREVATARFQLIVEAYEVLSNSQERAWYDSHREQILRGGDNDPTSSSGYSTKQDIWQYFSASCYDNRFDDRDGGFYKVYSDLFEEISRLEKDDSFDAAEASEDSDTHHHRTYPSFGDSRTEWEDVLNFYSQWGNFATSRYFGSFDKWDIRDGENRQVRRAMEAENKKARNAGRKEFSSSIRNLVSFVKRRDKRMAAYLVHQAKLDQEAKEQKERLAKEKEESRQAARVAAREEEVRRWEQYEAEKLANGEEIEVESSDKDGPTEFHCYACRKNFKSEKAFENHEQSKKHKQEIARLREELLLSEDDEAEPVITRPEPVKTKKSKQKKSTPAPEIVIEEESVEETILEPVVKERKPRRRRKDTEPAISGFVCQRCGETFLSKTNLFKHLDAMDHHAPKK